MEEDIKGYSEDSKVFVKTADLEKKNTEISDDLREKYFTFWLENQLYAISVHNMVGIMGIMPFRAIPGMPHYMKGIVNMRGDITPIVDMRLRLFKPESEYDSQTSIVLVNTNGLQVGYVVDKVNEVTTIPESEFTDSKQTSSEHRTDYITGISKHGGKVVLHVDLEILMQNEDLKINWN